MAQSDAAQHQPKHLFHETPAKQSTEAAIKQIVSQAGERLIDLGHGMTVRATTDYRRQTKDMQVELTQDGKTQILDYQPQPWNSIGSEAPGGEVLKWVSDGDKKTQVSLPFGYNSMTFRDTKF